MRTVVCLAILFVYPALADDKAESGAIERVIAAWNIQSKPLSDLFSPDAPDVQALLSEEPWSEVTRPYITIRSIHFFTSITALVEADSTQYGSGILKRKEPMLIVLRKYGLQWRIACVLVRNSK
jgi:hypothetical protein